MFACETGSPSPIPSDVPMGCAYCNTRSPSRMDFVAKRFPAATSPVTEIVFPSGISRTVPAAIGRLTTATLSAEFTIIAKLLIDAACKKASVDNQNLAGYKACCVGCEKHRSSRQLLDAAESLHGSAHQKFLAPLSPIQKFFIHRSTKDAGCDRVHTYPMLGPFDRQRFRKRP